MDPIELDEEFEQLAERYWLATLRMYVNWEHSGSDWQREMALRDLGEWLAERSGIARIQKECEAIVEERREQRRRQKQIEEQEKLESPQKFRKPLKPSQRTRILERDGYQCVWCHVQKKLQIDHIVPVSRGGSDEDTNLRTLCRGCNRKKFDQLDHEMGGAVEGQSIQ